MNPSVTRLAVAAAAGVLALSGCASQLAGLAPVGGDAMTAVRFAAIDVLLDQHYGILEAPVCTQVKQTVTCLGSLTDGQRVVVGADLSTKPHRMTVKVGDRVIYEGDSQSVLDRAARNEPSLSAPDATSTAGPVG
jgi:hypothetical protein